MKPAQRTPGNTMFDIENFQSPLAIAAVDPFVLRIPLAEPVKTPMGMVDSAIALMVRVQTRQGETGWGEAWCNFPRYGAFHRAVAVRRSLTPVLLSREFAGPYDAWRAMTQATKVVALQAGEPGPFANAIAGVDIALWDIAAKRERLPLWKLLGGERGVIDTYASLGRSHGCEPLIEQGLERGFMGFKLRCWSEPAEHMAAYEKARSMIGWDMELMADCNSSWPLDKAAEWSKQFASMKLSFIEEAIPVDSPLSVWKEVAAAAPTRLAGGENMISASTLGAAVDDGVLSVVQPDLCKWGGLSGVLPIARQIVARGHRYCPHIFSGAPGVLASAHVLAAANSPDGALEYPIEYNPPRDDFLVHQVKDGKLDIGDAPGLGIEVDVEAIGKYVVDTPNW